MHVQAKTSRPVFIEFRCQDTRCNLPRASASKRKEANFLRKFETAYVATEQSISFGGREFALEGFGRADLVWLAWEKGTSPADLTALALKYVRLTAIEGKVSDWRKGLQQAFRYRYFAHRSLLVLPMKAAETAARFLYTFRRLRVGLWGFDPDTKLLRKWCTPRATSPLNRKAWEKALYLFESNLNLGKLAKRG